MQLLKVFKKQDLIEASVVDVIATTAESVERVDICEESSAAFSRSS